MLQPKKTKFRKQFKGRISGTAKGGVDLNFGQFGLKAMEPERVNAAFVTPGVFRTLGVPALMGRQERAA